MFRNIFLAVVFNLVIVLFPAFSNAEDVESWFKSQGSTASDGTAVADAVLPVEPTVAAPEPAVEKVSTGTIVAKSASISTTHSLDEIIFKISRAQSNLENYGSDLNGHGPKAIEHLKEALQELQQAK